MATPLLNWGAEENAKRGVILLAFEEGNNGRGLHVLECVSGEENTLIPALASRIIGDKDSKFASILSDANKTVIAAKLFRCGKEAQN